MTGSRKTRRTTVITIVAVVSVLAAAVGILIALDDDHEAGSVLRPSDLTGLGVDTQHTAADECPAVGCLDSGLVVGPRAVQLDEVDLSFASTVFGGSFSRTYRSDLVAGDAGGGGLSAMFGPGWTSVFDSRLVIGTASADLATPPTGDRVAAVGRLDGTVSALWGSGELWQFDGRGRIVRIESPTGREVEVDWDGDGLSMVSFDGGQRFEVESDDGRVTEVTGSDGRTVTYRYSDGRLAGVSGPLGEDTYDYDDAGLLESASTPDGETEVAYDDTGHVSELSIGGSASFEVSGALPTVTVDDTERDSTSVYEFDSEGRLVRAVADGAQVFARSFDDSGRLVRSDSPGEHVEVSYDGSGRISRVVDNGAATGYAYDSLDRTVAVTDAGGGVVTYRYEGSSAVPSSVTDPLDGVSELSYEDGRLTKLVDPDGVAETYRYDDAGNLVSVTDGNGDKTTFDYDATGRMVGTETPEGARSRTVFDDAGRVQVLGDPDGSQTVFGYDASGEPTAVIGPEGVSSLDYDEGSRLTAQTGPTGARVDYDYTDGDLAGVSVTPSGASDPLEVELAGGDSATPSVSGPGGETRVVAYSDGRPTEIDLPGGRRESLRYDAAGRLTEVRIDGVLAAAYAYDPVGRLIRTEDGEGLVEERSYDRAGRLTQIRYPDDTRWTATWSAGGRIESVTDPESRQATWSYDNAGQVDAMTSPMGSTVQVEHDDDGRVIGLTEQRGVSWSYWYDAGGRLVTADTPAGSVDYRWDTAGRLISRVDSGGEQSQWLYDDKGRLANVKLPGDDNDLDWVYDGFGNVSSWEQGDQRWEVERDDAGRPTSVDLPEGDDYTVEWDDAGNPATIRYDGTTEQRTFDALGRVVDATYGDDETFEYRREGTSTVIVKQGDDDAEPVVQYERDDRGRVVQVQWGSDNEQVRAEWDYAGRPVTISSGDHQAAITRDDDGRLTQVQLDGDTALTAEYEDGQIASIATPDDNLLNLDYEEGQVSQAESGDLAISFDREGRPDTFRTGGDDGSFGYDDDGTVTGIQFGEEFSTATSTADGLETDGDAGDILQDVFEPDGSFRGLPAADAIPQFTHLDGLPAEFTPVGLTPESPEEQVAQTVAAIDVTVPEPLTLDDSTGKEIVSDAAAAILTTPLALPVHPASTALVPLFDDQGELRIQAFSPLDEPVWHGLLGGISERQDATGAFDWVTAQITNLADWTTAALSSVARSVIDSFTDPITLIAGIADIAVSVACFATALACPVMALRAITAAGFLFPAVVDAFTTDQSIADIALRTATAVAFVAAVGILIRAVGPALRGLASPGTPGVPTINGRTPINSGYAGRVYDGPGWTPDLAAKYPSGVRINDAGFPDFSPYARARARPSGLTGDYATDAAAANRAVGLSRTPPGHVWHHVEDRLTMLLIPQDIHAAIRHTGGAAMLRGG